MTKGTADSTGIKALRRSSRVKSKTTDDLPTGSKKTPRLDEETGAVLSNIKQPIAKVPAKHLQNTAIHDALEVLTTELRSLRAHVDELQAQRQGTSQQFTVTEGSSSPTPIIEYHEDDARSVNPAVKNANLSPSFRPLPSSGDADMLKPAVNNVRGSPPTHPLHPSGEPYLVNPAGNNAGGSPLLHPLPPPGEVYLHNPAVNNARVSHPFHPSGEAYLHDPAVNNARVPHPFHPSGKAYLHDPAVNNVRGSPPTRPPHPSGEPYLVNPAVNNATVSHPFHPSGEAYLHDPAVNIANLSPSFRPLPSSGEADMFKPAVNNVRGSPPTHPLHPSGGPYLVNPAGNNAGGSPLFYPLPSPREAYLHNPAVNNARVSHPFHPSGEDHLHDPAVNNAEGSPRLHPSPPLGEAHLHNPAVNNVRGSLPTHPLHSSGEPYLVNPSVNNARVSHPFHPSGEAYLHDPAVNNANLSPSVRPLPSSGEAYMLKLAVNNVRGSPSTHPLHPSGEPYLVNPAGNNAEGSPLLHPLPPPGEAYLQSPAINNVRRSPPTRPPHPSGEPYLVDPAVNNATVSHPFHPSGEAYLHDPAVNNARVPHPFHSSGKAYLHDPAANNVRSAGPISEFCRLPPQSEVNTVRHVDDESTKSPHQQPDTFRALQPTTHVLEGPCDTGYAISGNTEHQRRLVNPVTVVNRKLSVDACINQAQTNGSLLPDKALWCGTRDPSKRAFAETRQLVTTSSSYKWSPPCTQYFLTRQAYAPFIVQKLDLWEAKQDYGQLESISQDPHSAYWKEATRRQWCYLSTCYDKHNLDSLESRWRELKLTPDIHWDDYITRFEVIASQLAQARGVEALTQAEVRVHLYLSLPKALQAHCVTNGYNVGVQRMNYDGLVATCAGWCELNWQTATTSTSTAGVNNVALSTSPSTTSTSAQDKTDNKLRSARPSTPFRQRVKDDEAILNDEYNIKILSSRCQRCLSESHDTTACCEELTRKEERCYHCGLIHHHSRHCPTGYDNYRGPNCERCNKVNHAARACRRFRPCSAQVAAAIPIANSSSPVVCSDGPLSFVDLHINHSTNCIPALVDSGAAVSVINSSTASCLSLTVSQTNLRIRLADLSETAVRGVAKSVVISFSNGLHFTEDLYILDGCAHQLILSVGLLRRLKAIWHLHGNYITFDDNKSSQPIPMMSAPKQQYNTSRSPSCSSDVANLCSIIAPETKTDTITISYNIDDDDHPNTIILPVDVWETLALSFFPEPREEASNDLKGLSRSQTIDAFRLHLTDSEDITISQEELFDFSIDPPSESAPRGRLHCKVPWRNELRPSTTHNNAAIKRDFVVMARLSNAEASSYHQVVNDLYSLGFVIPARLDTTTGADSRLPKISTLIPAFPVFREDSKTSRTRLVLDCKYLNGFLKVGRQANDLTYPETLWSNLALCRTARALVVDDISKAYHQIMLDDEADRRHFGMVACGRVGMWVSTVFGATYSPSALLQANRAVLTLRDFETGHISRAEACADPVCSSLISQFEKNMKLWVCPRNETSSHAEANTSSINHHVSLRQYTAIYVDDGQTRGTTKEEALDRANSFTGAQSGHGFQSNLAKRSVSWGPPTVTKYLGYVWHTGDYCDEFLPTFRVPEGINLEEPPSSLTRRQLFALCQGLYDPLGMASEFSLCLRYFMATYYATGSTDEADKSNDLWDSRIDPEGATNVLAFCRTLSTVKIAFPRFVDISNVLVFTDASVTAGHTTILCPTTVANSDKFYRKLVGKGRLWSTRTSQARWSIPKKELVSFFDGLSLAASLVTIYSKFAAETPIKSISLYCDSEALVYRLRRASKGDFGKNLSSLEKKTLKKGLLDLDFIANTLQVSVTTYHIEGDFNPADTGSRPKIDGELPVE